MKRRVFERLKRLHKILMLHGIAVRGTKRNIVKRLANQKKAENRFIF